MVDGPSPTPLGRRRTPPGFGSPPHFGTATRRPRFPTNHSASQEQVAHATQLKDAASSAIITQTSFQRKRSRLYARFPWSMKLNAGRDSRGCRDHRELHEVIIDRDSFEMEIAGRKRIACRCHEWQAFLVADGRMGVVWLFIRS